MTKHALRDMGAVIWDALTGRTHDANQMLQGQGRSAQSVTISSQEYWTSYNVTGHRKFASCDESLRYFHWRSSQYYDYIDLMPVSGLDGKRVLDYGCGPGHDLAGFAVYSKPARLVGVDVSQPSLAEADARVRLHGARVELFHIDENEVVLPFDVGSFDYIHSSGVLHHTPDPLGILHEWRRILKRDGEIRLMVYNYDCIWLHLYAAYTVRFRQPGNRGLDVREAFKRSTDTVDCPISHAWVPAEVAEMARESSFRCEHLGNAVSVREIAILPDRFDAILDPEFESEHRQFLLALTFDARGVPYYRGQAAGIDACYRLTPA